MNSVETSGHQDWWDDLSENQKHHINEGLMDAQHGRVVSSKDFWNKLKNGEEDVTQLPNSANS